MLEVHLMSLLRHHNEGVTWIHKHKILPQKRVGRLERIASFEMKCDFDVVPLR